MVLFGKLLEISMHCGKCNKKFNYGILRGFIVEKAVESQ
jgi:hypothetical protein